jgi:transposase InsO family protein
MKNKFETFNKFLIYKAFVEKQTSQNIIILKSDWRGEYKSKGFFEYCQKEGIKKEFIIAYTPQHNDISERKKKH